MERKQWSVYSLLVEIGLFVTKAMAMAMARNKARVSRDSWFALGTNYSARLPGNCHVIFG